MTPRWLNIYMLAVAVAVLVLAVGGLVRADPAVVDTAAQRMMNARQETDTLPPPPKPASLVCNQLTYRSYDSGPSGICFRAVTAERGWSQGKIDAWFPFIVSEFSGVIQGESGHCWNARRNLIIEAFKTCSAANQIRIGPIGDDTGFGQATYVLWGPNGPLCVKHGYCGWQSIIRSPYDSMLASIVLLVEDQGSDPWCFDRRSINYHQCWEAPDR